MKKELILLLSIGIYLLPLRGQNDAYSGIGRVYFREGKTDSAIWYAVRATDLPCGRQYPIRLLKPAQLLTDIYEARHQTDSTLKYLRNTIALKDSLFSQHILKEKNNNLITQKNGQLQHLVTEKEWLLKELQHQAIPVGLILNEAITNTFKYAFINICV